ncbi:ABC transporter permease [Agrobacterium tumefaciens]|uniref:ABC transporter permease n=1 Tax=Agrobacterium tumefaciens TaxID=358 RepID=A0A4D7YNM2_AGRTU|nr:ABC transporter permease [Agrobacterium tumefaciens]QCL98075.1 ABC transporter permease [Agrobacterium tumefaciens]
MTKSGTLSNLHTWLINEEFSSSRQARLHNIYIAWLSLVANPLALAGFVVIVFLIIMASLAPLMPLQDPIAQDFMKALQAPSAVHWFGTDEFGRDVFARLVYGGRTTLYIAILVTVIVGPIGFVIGATAGYLGGWVDVVLMRVTDIFLSFPSLVLALAFSAALGPGIENAVIAIALTVWPPIARLARAETLTFRHADFVVAAELQGASMARILLRHIVPLCAPSVIVRLTLNMSSIILTAAGLGFLGLGAQPPLPEWGSMAASGRQYLLDAWWLTTVPGIAILVVSLAFNLLGDGLRDIMDPRNA